MRRLAAAAFMLPLLTLIACSKLGPPGGGSGASASEPAPAAAASPAAQPRPGAPAAPQRDQVPGAPPPNAPPKVSRKLERTVDLDLTVSQTTGAEQAAERLAARLGGYVASMSGERVDEAMRYEVTLRLPAEHLDAAVDELKKLAVRVDREQQKTDDLTDQYVDLDARLRTLRSTEAELQALLAESRQRQRGAQDIIEVYRELNEIRTHREQMQGQILLMDKLVALSTVNLRLLSPEAARPVAGEAWQPLAALRDSLRTLLDLLRGLGNFVIFAVIVLLPAVLVLAAALHLLRRLWRWLRPRKTAQPQLPR